jgi:hypothetical protein
MEMLYSQQFVSNLFFSEFLAQHIKNGAETIFIISRDPFPHNKYFNNLVLLFGRVQAITFQKNISKSVWGGMSYIINSEGTLITSTCNSDSVIINDIFLNKTISPFCNAPNLIAKLALFISSLFFILLIIKRIHEKINLKSGIKP